MTPLIARSDWTIERHGDGYVLYSGRGPMAHGMNLVRLSEPDGNWPATKRLIESVPKMLLALEAIVKHQDMVGGDMSEVRMFAASGIMAATGEKV